MYHPMPFECMPDASPHRKPRKNMSMHASVNLIFQVHSTAFAILSQPDEDILFFEDRYLNGELNIMFDELNVPFSDQEVMNACKQIHNGKSSGPDYLLNEFF